MSGGAVKVATSEAEYVVLSSAAQEAKWLRRLLQDLQMNLIVIFEN